MDKCIWCEETLRNEDGYKFGDGWMCQICVDDQWHGFVEDCHFQCGSVCSDSTSNQNWKFFGPGEWHETKQNHPMWVCDYCMS
jgi:hypothetical protein